MNGYKYFLKKDMINAITLSMNFKKKLTDMIVLEVYQNYSNTYIEILNEEEINKIFQSILDKIELSLHKSKLRIKKIIFSLEMEPSSVPDIDTVFFRFLIIGRSLKGLDEILKDKIKPFVTDEIGGNLDTKFKPNQSYTDIITELMPVRLLETPSPPKNPSLKKYYSNDLYKALLDSPKEYVF